jgi:thiopeptide-type bacteriocin biosynthesis protein
MKKIQPLDFYLIRIPAFSLDNLIKLNSVIELYPDNKNIEELKDIFSNPFFEKAIYLSSKSLYNEFIKFKENKVSDIKKEKRLIKSLYKYYVRMSTRPTPYGLFAGYFFGEITSRMSDIKLSNIYLSPQVDIDMNVLASIQNHIIDNNAEIKKNELYYSNNTIYKFNTKYRYTNFIKSKGEKKLFLTEIYYSELLEHIIYKSKNGIHFDSLIQTLIDEVDEVSARELEEYVRNLIELNILVYEEIGINVEKSPSQQLYEKYRSTINLECINNLHLIEKDLSIEKIVELEKKMLSITNTEFDQYLNIKLKINTDSSNLNISIIEEVSGYVSELIQIQNKTTPKDLLEFKRKFLEKYDSQEIPLMDAIDFDLGLGYGLQVADNMNDFSLIDKISYFEISHQNKNKIDEKMFEFLDRKLKEFELSDTRFIEILSDDIQELKQSELNTNDNVENSFIMGTLLSESLSEFDKGNYTFLSKSNLPTPFMANLLSRFSYLDEKSTQLIRKNINTTTSNDKIYAEIVYNPGGRLGNIILRPNFYDYHISYGETNLQKMESIEISTNDLYISVQNNRIVLRSKKLQKEVIPKLTSAYNYNKDGIPLIRFLCDLQYQKVNTGFIWDWNNFSQKEYLPRVIYKKIILCPAQWNFKKNQVKDLEFKLDEISKKSKYCFIADGDHELVLDLTNRYSKKLVKEELEKKDITLFEFIDLQEKSIIRNYVNEPFSSEIIIPFKNNNIDRIPNLFNNHNNPEIVRKFYPNEKWIYYKLYLSNNISDEILVNCFKKLIKKLINNNEINGWFFIRYEDPKSHVRIRFRKKNISMDVLTKDIISACQEYFECQLISDFSIHTYERELERYDQDLIDCSENIFINDSNAILDILEIIKDNSNISNLREKIAIINVNMLLDDFKLTTNEKLEIMDLLSSNFINEFIDLKQKEKTLLILKRSLNQKLREEKEFLNQCIFQNQVEDFLVPLVKILEKRSKKNISNLNEIQNQSLTKDEKYDLISSFIHMSLNRLLYAKQRAQEMVIYYLLKETYNSILNRNDKQKTNCRYYN